MLQMLQIFKAEILHCVDTTQENISRVWNIQNRYIMLSSPQEYSAFPGYNESRPLGKGFAGSTSRAAPAE